MPGIMKQRIVVKGGSRGGEKRGRGEFSVQELAGASNLKDTLIGRPVLPRSARR